MKPSLLNVDGCELQVEVHSTNSLFDVEIVKQGPVVVAAETVVSKGKV
jgi:hypothetical protein